MASGLMVQEEEADEFKAEPEPREVENARLRGAVGPKPFGVAEQHRRVTKVVLTAVIGMMKKEF